MSNMLPPIVATSDEVRRLYGLANSNMTFFTVYGAFPCRRTRSCERGGSGCRRRRGASAPRRWPNRPALSSTPVWR